MSFRPLVWLGNSLRNRLRQGMTGRILAKPLPRPRRLRVVSATRADEKAFWKTSATGQSLATWRNDARLAFDIAFQNTRGLPAVYNAAMDRAGTDEALLFIHDDIWLDDPQWIDKLLLALDRYDVVGVAGNTRRVRNQPSWLHTKVENGQFFLDAPHLSGAVAHGPRPRGDVTVFGPTPARCELLDGLFIAARNDVARRSGVRWDERFQFHFYDLDFCRTARAAGLSLGTWPIEMTHQSHGAFKSPGWQEGLARYRGKWQG